jgi:hypothetical protein
MSKIKFGLDIHGVIDRDPGFFAYMSYILTMEGHEIYILTGREICDELRTKLSDMKINHTELFSITSYHKEAGTYITYKDGDPTQPLIAPPLWDRTKADYCERKGIDIHIDDSVVYGKYFNDIKTQYILYDDAMRKFLFEMASWEKDFKLRWNLYVNLLRPYSDGNC